MHSIDRSLGCSVATPAKEPPVSVVPAPDPRLEEPTRPGTSAKYLGGRPFTQYVISFIISSVFLFA